MLCPGTVLQPASPARMQDPAAQQAAAQELYSSVALELLQQAAKAMERTLLDGGPCRW
jgi:hypothetical protein